MATFPAQHHVADCFGEANYSESYSMDGTLDDGIADRLRRNDPNAVESLVSVFQRPIYRFLICRGADPMLAKN